MVLAEEISEGFVRQILHAPARILGKQVKREPNLGRELDQLTLDVARMLAWEHARRDPYASAPAYPIRSAWAQSLSLLFPRVKQLGNKDEAIHDSVT